MDTRGEQGGPAADGGLLASRPAAMKASTNWQTGPWVSKLEFSFP